MQNWDQYKDLEYYPDRVCACGCGSRIAVKSYHKYHGIPSYISGHNNKILKEICYCECGCEGTFECRVNSKQRFIYGHSGRNRSLSEEHRRKIGDSQRGRNSVLRETRICKASDCDIAFECRVTDVKKYCSVCCSRRGKSSWNKDLTKKIDSRVAELAERRSEDQKKLWQDFEYSERQVRAIIKGWKTTPNIPEKFLIKFLQELFPGQWKFVGDGQFILAGKNPDFVNVNGQKKIIEHFGEYHHGEGMTGISNELHEQQRVDLFAQHGYQTLIIWGHELEEVEQLQNKLEEFCVQ